MDCLPVLCLGNNCAKYDGKVWYERIVDVIERNGEAVIHPRSLAAFNEGDSVIVQRVSKGKRTIWNGRVTFKTYAELSKERRSSESKKPIKKERPVKRKKTQLTEETAKRTKIGECLNSK